jgi:hypothetical protein
MKTPKKPQTSTQHPSSASTDVDQTPRAKRNQQRMRNWHRKHIAQEEQIRVLGAMSVAQFIDLLEEIGA